MDTPQPHPRAAADQVERFRYVFGDTVDPEEWAEADEDEQAELLERRFGPMPSAQGLVKGIVVSQVVAGEPPVLWPTVCRLDADGFDADAVLNQLTLVLTEIIQEALEADGEGDDDQPNPGGAYRDRLGRLPLPAPEALEEAMVDVASEAGVIDEDKLVALATARFGGWADDPLLARLAGHSIDHLMDWEAGPLVVLAGDGVGHVDRLREGIVLTHVLTDAEVAVGALTVSVDLAGFGRIAEPSLDGEPLECVSLEPGQVMWTGDEGWLERFPVGATLAVTVDADGGVEIEPLPDAPPVDDALVAALRRAYHAYDESELPVAAEDLVFGMLAEDRAVFSEARAPLAALCEAGGLEQRGSAFADDPARWTNLRRLRRAGRVFAATGDDEDLATGVLDVLDLADALAEGNGAEPGPLREAFEALDDLEVLVFASDQLFDDDRWPEESEAADALVTALLAAARRPHERATARYLAALSAEMANDPEAAENHLRLAVEADGDHALAVDRLAWYASDRGEAARAVKLWRRCPQTTSVTRCLATIEPFTRAAGRRLGRNERCWCGSGRKYKQCHLGVAETPPLPDRVGWLCTKATAYLERRSPAARRMLLDLAAARAGDDDEESFGQAMEDPLIPDLALTEGGWFDRFLADRSAVLPDDEALLAAAWAAVDRTVYEVTDVTAGAGLTVRDLRTGDTLNVRERTFSRQARTGMLICARAVPDGETHQLVGAVLPLPPGRESGLLELLDEGDPYEIAEWVRALEAPPQLVTREGEPLVECEIVVAVDDGDALAAHLDAAYDRDPDGGPSWIEHHDLDEKEALVRARLNLDDERLTISTNSRERADRILDRLREALGGVTVVTDTRTPVDLSDLGASRAGGQPDLSALPAAPDVPDEAIAEIQEHMERRWCDEQVPALGGLTPRQAAADPTRREQLERLLNSFDAMPAPPGGFTMRTDKLRDLLGL